MLVKTDNLSGVSWLCTVQYFVIFLLLKAIEDIDKRDSEILMLKERVQDLENRFALRVGLVSSRFSKICSSRSSYVAPHIQLDAKSCNGCKVIYSFKRTCNVGLLNCSMCRLANLHIPLAR